MALYFSEERSQKIAQAIRAGNGYGALLQALVDAYGIADSRGTRSQLVREDLVEVENFAPGGARLNGGERAALTGRLRPFVLPALSHWVKQNADGFARAAAHPDTGVTVRIRLRPVAGLGQRDMPKARALRTTDTSSAPNVSVSVDSGFRRP